MIGSLHQAALLGWGDEDFATRSESQFAAVVGNMSGSRVVGGLLDPVLAEVIEIGRQINGDELVGAGRDVVEPQIGAELVDNASLGERGCLHVPPLVMRV